MNTWRKTVVGLDDQCGGSRRTRRSTLDPVCDLKHDQMGVSMDLIKQGVRVGVIAIVACLTIGAALLMFDLFLAFLEGAARSHG